MSVSGTARRVVLVDNDRAVLDLLVLDLGLEGHDILATALTGEDGLRLCDDLRPDVVVVDFRLGPGIDGVEVARRIGPDGPRVVLFTNYVNRAVVRGARDAGAVVVEKGNLNALRRAIVDP